MILTRNDLTFYLQEDQRRNECNGSYLRYLIRLFLGNESACAFHYLKALRYCEYHFNQHGLFNKLSYYYYKIKMQRIGCRYHIQIPLNKTGYGLRIMHLSGGGVFY